MKLFVQQSLNKIFRQRPLLSSTELILQSFTKSHKFGVNSYLIKLYSNSTRSKLYEHSPVRPFVRAWERECIIRPSVRPRMGAWARPSVRPTVRSSVRAWARLFVRPFASRSIGAWTRGRVHPSVA